MQKYIAFLRGINISGKNKIPMADLKRGFEELGYTNVATYLNSGNVVFGTQQEEKTVKSDLIALKKTKDKYKVIFIELKENISASIGGFTSNIGEHIIDTLNFKKLYTVEKEKLRFKKYVEYNLRFKANHNLLDIEDVEGVIKNIDFNDAPDIMIACGFDTETGEQLRKKLKNKFENHDKYADYIEWNNIIIVGPKEPGILLQNGIPINEFLKGE